MDINGWKSCSRYTSEYLSEVIHTGSYLTDISPLPQLIAVIFIALSGTIILHIFKDGKKITFLNLISVIPLGLSPYFLECFSYKFDAPYMALSVLASVFSFLFYNIENRKSVLFFVMTFLGTIIMCTTYQAASGIILLIALFLAFKFWNNKESKEAIKLLVFTGISYFLGLLVFKIIMKPVDTYVSSGLLPLKELIPGFLNSLVRYYKYIINDFRNIWLLLILIISICFIFSNVKQSKQNKVICFILSIILLGMSAIVTFGLYPALKKPLFSPRGMYGFGAFLALIAVNATNSEKMQISKIASLVLVWCLIIFSFTYGNALNEQKRYIDFRVQSVINGLNELDIMNTDTLKYVKITGSIGRAPSIENMPPSYQKLINRLIIQTFSGNWVWDRIYFDNYFKIKNISSIADFPDTPSNMEVVKNTMYYEIKTNNKDCILINLK